MCEWCVKYGDGDERWYFNPANYARRLYKVRKEGADASGSEANPQTAGGMAVVGQDFLEASAVAARYLQDFITVRPLE